MQNEKVVSLTLYINKYDHDSMRYVLYNNDTDKIVIGKKISINFKIRRNTSIFRRKIRYYKCDECGEISSAKDINDATKEYFKSNDIEPITGDKYDGDYMCPKCKEVFSGDSFEEVK